MSFRFNRRVWESLGASDPYWAILSAEEKRGGGWDQDEFFASGTATVAGLLGTLAALDATPPLGRALDFGCGLGRLSWALAAQFESVVGVDVADSMIQRATALHRASSNCLFLQNARPDLQIFADGTFDLVCSLIVLQHVSPRHADNYIREFVRVTRPGGIIVFQIPSHLTAEHLAVERLGARLHRSPLWPTSFSHLARRVRRLPPQYEVSGIRVERVRELLSAAGAEIVEVEENRVAGPLWVSYSYTARALR